MHSGAFEEDQYDFLISMINKNKIKLHFTLNSNLPCGDDFNDDDDDEVDRTEQIFNFVDVWLFVFLQSGSPNEPIYFVKIIEKRAASENHSDQYGHFISAGEKFLKEFYLNLVRPENTSKTETSFVNRNSFSPDEVSDIYLIFRRLTY